MIFANRKRRRPMPEQKSIYVLCTNKMQQVESACYLGNAFDLLSLLLYANAERRAIFNVVFSRLVIIIYKFCNSIAARPGIVLLLFSGSPGIIILTRLYVCIELNSYRVRPCNFRNKRFAFSRYDTD